MNDPAKYGSLINYDTLLIRITQTGKFRVYEARVSHAVNELTGFPVLQHLWICSKNTDPNTNLPLFQLVFVDFIFIRRLIFEQKLSG